MMQKYRNILDCIGNTPLVPLTALAKERGARAAIYVKVESVNPGGSVKDRLALAMVDAAEKEGLLTPGKEPAQSIIEPTSGNTGIGLALVAAVRGYSLTLTMPESMSAERIALLRGLGAQLVLTPAAAGMGGAVAEAERLTAATPGAVMLSQFTNPVGPAVHFATTGQEIWEGLDGKVDIAVAGIGTGGTITGVGRLLKSKNPAVRVYGVEPAESAVLSGKPAGAHLIQGIGAGFVPEILDRSILDGVLAVPGEEALCTARLLMQWEGLFCGISSGAAVAAALTLAVQEENAGKNIVCIAPDTADRYLSTKLFTEA